MGERDRVAVLPSRGIDRALIDAAGSLMGRWGVTKTTVADLAREAGCSRATVYRLYPGGKRQIMALYGLCELQEFFASAQELTRTADSVDDALVAVITAAARGLAGHEGFQFMLVHEPGLVLPYLGFSQIDRLYRLVADALAPSFERFVGNEAPLLLEMAARITLSYTFLPSSDVDLCDEHDVRRIVERHLLPSFQPTLAVPA